ncbi:MAG: filamentous hemagglutinin N-terminal domain-containing protein [Desulfobacteraceae bacterium]
MIKADQKISKSCQLLILFFFISAPLAVLAQVSTDGTVGPARSLSGPDYQITEDLGTTVGQNLFHSFHDFSIAYGESATFTGPDSILNVISRVTGGEVSSINGLLRSRVGQADFFFVNPAGVVFGPDAQVDVPGAFHVTTADELQFADGNIFSSATLDVSTLTMAEPASFGFLTARPASIILNGAQLNFTPESTITLAGGDIIMTGSQTSEAGMISPGGKIHIKSVGEALGEVPVSGEVPYDLKGKLVLESSRISSSGNKGGKIEVQAGEIKLFGAELTADNTGEDDSDGGIEFLIDGDLSISHGSRVQCNAFNKGDSDKILVKANNILIEQIGDEDLTGIFSEVEPGAEGDAGGIVINAIEDVKIQGVGQITSSTYGDGHAGNVTVNAANIVVDGQGRSTPYRNDESPAGISSETLSESTSHSGTVLINVVDHFSIINSGAISGCTYGAGNAGDVLVKAGSLTIDGRDCELLTGIYSQGNTPESTGRGGLVDVDVNGLLEIIGNNAYISSGTLGKGSGGDVFVQADTLFVDTNNGTAGILSTTLGSGDAGDLTIDAEDIHISGAGRYNSGFISDTYGKGNAGSVNVSATGFCEILNGARISSDTWSEGYAGSVVVNAGDLTIDRQDSEFLRGISSQANIGSTGNAGVVKVNVAGSCAILNESQISSGTLSEGTAIMPGIRTVNC